MRHEEGVGVGVVKYLGEYRISGAAVEDTQHIMLEYGEQDLDEFLAETCTPILNTEIVAFWESFFKVAKTLERIHRLDHRGEDGNMREFKGYVPYVSAQVARFLTHLSNSWHGDIKPDNVLRVRREFKLADFGFSKFEEHESKTELTGGTRTYGKNPYNGLPLKSPLTPQGHRSAVASTVVARLPVFHRP